MTTEELIQKFVEEVRHSIRKEIIAQIANGGMPGAPHPFVPTAVMPFSKPVTNGHSKKLPIEPAQVLELLDGGDGMPNVQLAARLGRGTQELRPLLMELEGKGIIRRTGQRRGTRWFRVEPEA